MTQFSQLGLSEPIRRALTALGYETPTPIQAQSIPIVLEGHDLLGIAQTGTGKTAAFALPTLDILSRTDAPPAKNSTRALILAPTRELAAQIGDNYKLYSQFMNLKVVTVFGGVPIRKHVSQLKTGTDILVATPGRLLNLIDDEGLTLDYTEIVILDEADQMMDLGFIHALKRLMRLLPDQRQTLFFSATMPKAITSLANGFLTNPKKVSVTPVAKTADRVNQSVIFVEQPDKTPLLIMKIRELAMDRALVFSRTKHGANKIVNHLLAHGITAAAIHGNKSQSQREKSLREFKSGQVHILVATDIAARGIDIDSVGHVINFDLPNVPEQYVHRIGRTGRAGKEGIAIAFCAKGDERQYLKQIEKLIKQKITPEDLPETFAEEVIEIKKIKPVKPKREPRGGGRGRSQGGRNQGGRGKPKSGGKPRHKTRSGQAKSSGQTSGGETVLSAKPKTDARTDARQGDGQKSRPQNKSQGKSQGKAQGNPGAKSKPDWAAAPNKFGKPKGKSGSNKPSRRSRRQSTARKPAPKRG